MSYKLSPVMIENAPKDYLTCILVEMGKLA